MRIQRLMSGSQCIIRRECRGKEGHPGAPGLRRTRARPPLTLRGRAVRRPGMTRQMLVRERPQNWAVSVESFIAVVALEPSLSTVAMASK